MEERRRGPRVTVDVDVEAKIGEVAVRVSDLSEYGAKIDHEERFPLFSPEMTLSFGGTTVTIPLRIVRSEIGGRKGEKLTYRTGVEFTGNRTLAHELLMAIMRAAVVKAAEEAGAAAVAARETARTEREGAVGSRHAVSAPAEAAGDIREAAAPAPVAEAPAPAAEASAPVASTPPYEDAAPALADVAAPVAEAPTPEPARPAPEATRPAPEPVAAERERETPRRLSLDDSWTRQVNFLTVDPEDSLPYAQFRLVGDRWTKVYVRTAEQPEDGFTIPRDQTDFAEIQHTFEIADPETRRMMQIAMAAKLEK